MKSKTKQIIISFFILTIILALYLIYKLGQRTIYNDISVTGNTAGNLYNGGLFCERDGIIYFSNDKDNGALYSMDLTLSNVKKLSNDKPFYLNVDDNYIYYSRANYTQKNENSSIFSFYNHGLYRINKNGKNSKSLSNEITDASSLSGNYIYFQVYKKGVGLDLYKIKIDGDDYSLVSTVNIKPFSIINRTLYYAPDSNSDNHYIRTLNLDTGNDSIIYSGNCYMPIAVSDGIYYISLEDGYSICHISYTGENKKIITNEFCSFFNISDDERFLYYQIDGGSDNRIAMMDLETMTQTTLSDGNYKNIHVIGKYVFFRDFNEENTYVYDITSGIISIFKAPVVK